MHGIEVKRDESDAQIKEHKTWLDDVIKHPPPALLFFLSFLLPSGKLALRVTGSFAPPTSRFSRRALELRRVFRLTVYLLRARVPQVIPPVDRRGKPREKSSRSEFPDTFSSIYGATVPAEFI